MSDAVVDASIVVRLLLDPSEELLRTLDGYAALHAPAHLDVECWSALRGLLLGGQIDSAIMSERTLAIAAMPIRRHLTAALLPRAGQMAYHASACDAEYIALAEALHADLITGDARLASVPSIRCDVRVV